MQLVNLELDLALISGGEGIASPGKGPPIARRGPPVRCDGGLVAREFSRLLANLYRPKVRLDSSSVRPVRTFAVRAAVPVLLGVPSARCIRRKPSLSRPAG